MTSYRDEQPMLLESGPIYRYGPPYFGGKGRTGVRLDTVWDHVADRVARSWKLTVPRRLPESGGR